MLKPTEDSVLQCRPGMADRSWSIQELLETYNPLPDEPLATRNAAILQVMPSAEYRYSDLSTAARLGYDFWKQLVPSRIPEQTWNYTVKIAKTYSWSLTLNQEGLFYRDISGLYGHAGLVHEQLLSDFWFYGPLLPIPDLDTRKWLVAHLRNAFRQAGSPASYAHFDLSEYPPEPEIPMQWVEGDQDRSDFVNLRGFGIEIGHTNWHDGLVYLIYISFERFANQPGAGGTSLTPEIRAEIERYLLEEKCRRERKSSRADEGAHSPPPSHDEPVDRELQAPSASAGSLRQRQAESKRLFMDNGGQTHYIYLDGFGEIYQATAAEEAAWRKELIEQYRQRIKLEDSGTILTHIARNLQLNGATDVEQLLLDAAASATPKAKQAIAQALTEACNSEKGVDILISLLEYEQEEPYWRNYVFNAFFHLRNNRAAHRFLLFCLHGNNEAHFNKAVDVFRFWGIQGDKALADPSLLKGLNWEDATAADPDFTKSLEKLTNILNH